MTEPVNESTKYEAKARKCKSERAKIGSQKKITKNVKTPHIRNINYSLNNCKYHSFIPPKS